MPKLPALTAKELVRILKRAGFHEDRQKGSHLVLLHPVTMRRVVIPIHSGKTIKRPLLQSIIQKDMGISVDEFLHLLKDR